MFFITFWLLAFLPLLNAIPTGSPGEATGLRKRCTNYLQNPSFESGLSPWLDITFGSWEQRGVFTSAQGGHDGRNFYFGETNATVAHCTLTLSQSSISIPSGTTVDCSAWVATNRPGNYGSTRVEIFVDEVTCGSPVYLGTNPWVKVGGKLTVQGDSHTLAIVVVSDETGPAGSQVWVDDAMVGTGC